MTRRGFTLLELLLATLIRDHVIAPASDAPPFPVAGVTLRAKGGMPLIVRPAPEKLTVSTPSPP